MRHDRLKVKKLLDEIYAEYGRKYLDTDPVYFPRLFESPPDIEVVAFYSALLAFGNVVQIKRSISALLTRLGPEPANSVISFGSSGGSIFSGFRHRFVTGEQLDLLTLHLGRALSEKGSIRSIFMETYAPGDMVGSLSRFVGGIKERAGDRRDDLKFLFPDPLDKSPCKRLFLFLRWMVRRDDGVDFGIFREVNPGDLVIPLDTHVGRISRLLGFTSRKSDDIKTALEITERLKELEPDDPVKYDFALTRIGIVSGCRGIYSEGCEKCSLSGICLILTAQKGQVSR